jgi:hypothetical protein
MLIQKIYKNLGKISIVLFLLMTVLNSFLVNFESGLVVSVKASILSPTTKLNDEDCAEFPAIQIAERIIGPVVGAKKVGPCLGSDGIPYFDCEVFWPNITDGVGSCSQKSDAGSVSACMANKNGFEKGPITDTPECRKLTAEACAFEWDINTVKGCKDLFGTKPNVSTLTGNTNAAVIAQCQPLTEDDKKIVDTFNKNGTITGNIGANYEKVCKDTAGKIYADCTLINGKTSCNLPINEAAKNQQLKLTAGTDKAGASNALGSIITIIGNLILAVLSLIAWFFGTVLSYIMFLLGWMLIVLIRVNPAAGDWIGVALAPWGVVQSIANLIILGTFIFVAFAYILDITKYKTKIDSFLTNIVIVAIVMNLTLLGCASIINIAQGVGDAFVGGYATIKNVKDPGDYNGIAQVFIGDTLTSFKKVSAIRCNNVNGTSAGTGTSAQTPAKTGTTQTIAQAKTAAECGDFEGKDNLGVLFGNKFNSDIGANGATLVREMVYIAIVIFGIYAFFRIMMLALIRAVSLWLLMVTSPLALVAYFSPEGFGLKKMADKWGHNFFHFTVFYPAFVLGLILAQEMTAAFNTATTAAVPTIKAASGATVEANTTQTIILVLLGGIVAVGILKLLADFFEGVLKEITEAAFNGVKSLATGGAALLTAGAVGARAIAGVAPGVSGMLSKGLSKKMVSNESEINTLTAQRDALPNSDRNKAKLNTRIVELQKEQASNQKRLDKYNWVNTKSSNFRDNVVNPVANFAEMIPERFKAVASIPGTIKQKWAADEKARIESFKAGDKAKSEIWLRENEWAQGIFGSPDKDPNALFRGYSADKIAEEKGKNADWGKNKINTAVKNAYSKSLGLNNKISRDIAVSRAQELLKQAGGEYENLTKEMRDQFDDLISQHSGDSSIMSQFANDSTLKNATRKALKTSNNIDSDAATALRKSSPIFLEDANDRRQAMLAMGEQDFKNLAAYNLQDEDIVTAARANNSISFQEMDKKMNNRGHTYLAEGDIVKSLDDQLKTGKIDENEYNRQRNSSNQRYQNGFIGGNDIARRIANERRLTPNLTREREAEIAAEVEEENFGNDSHVEAIISGTTYLDPKTQVSTDYGAITVAERMEELRAVAPVIQSYMADNEEALNNQANNQDQAKAQQVLKELQRNINTSRSSYNQSKEMFIDRQRDVASSAAEVNVGQDAAKAIYNQELSSLDSMRALDGDRLRAALNHTRFATVPGSVNPADINPADDLKKELGIRKTFASVTKQLKAADQKGKASRAQVDKENDPARKAILESQHLTEVNGKNYDLRDVSKKSQELENHLSRLNTVYNAIDATKPETLMDFQSAIDESKRVFRNSKGATSLIEDSFTVDVQNQTTTNAFSNDVDKNGLAELDEIRKKVEGKILREGHDLNSIDNDLYASYFQDYHEKTTENLKDRQKKAADAVITEDKKVAREILN